MFTSWSLIVTRSFKDSLVFFDVTLMSHVLFYIIFSKRPLHLTINLTCTNNLNKIDKNTKYNMSSFYITE